MDGCLSNFEDVAHDFEARLPGSMYVAVDLELTGVSEVGSSPDSYAESATKRIAKMCSIAETHAPVQLGLTLVCEGLSGQATCASYNFYCLPYDGVECLSRPSFGSRPSSLKFLRDRHFDFNRWIQEGVPYVCREDEDQYLESLDRSGEVDPQLAQKVGLLRVWKALKAAKKPLVVHCPLDLFFLLTTFERRRLPRDPRELASLVLQCFPCVYDTAYLHGSIGDFSTLGLTGFMKDALRRHNHLVAEGNARPLLFTLEARTEARYGGTASSRRAHEAGYDSLVTAQLFALLFRIDTKTVAKSNNRLFLYKSTEYLDLQAARDGGEISGPLFKPPVMTIVARLGLRDDMETMRRISKAGFQYKRIDSWHVLVIFNGDSEGSEEAAAGLSVKLTGVRRWLQFEQWQKEEESLLSSRSDSICSENLGSSASTAASSDAQPSPTRQAALPSDDECSEPDTAQRFLGCIKSFESQRGFGFLECPHLFAKYGRDVFLHHKQMNNFDVGQFVSFAIRENDRGHPQAHNLKAVDPFQDSGHLNLKGCAIKRAMAGQDREVETTLRQ
eukprot:CAMPEP_0170603230 /NCGR_PEP_ID=MMETSP0224-20130122/18803_1 /TAXON_ID=285029 /ORGANISM="Togula jolla, Strain CCCM 725" /LENGTH=557 /DNA_ID=CAMNT_0010928101 /DNA_START=47 /DNA_END=1720 /DNA_ORIENTATION=-